MYRGPWSGVIDDERSSFEYVTRRPVNFFGELVLERFHRAEVRPTKTLDIGYRNWLSNGFNEGPKDLCVLFPFFRFTIHSLGARL